MDTRGLQQAEQELVSSKHPMRDFETRTPSFRTAEDFDAKFGVPAKSEAK